MISCNRQQRQCWYALVLTDQVDYRSKSKSIRYSTIEQTVSFLNGREQDQTAPISEYCSLCTGLIIMARKPIRHRVNKCWTWTKVLKPHPIRFSEPMIQCSIQQRQCWHALLWTWTRRSLHIGLFIGEDQKLIMYKLYIFLPLSQNG